MRARLLLAAALALGCVRVAPGVGPPARPTALAYDAVVLSTSPWLIEVTLTLDGGAPALLADASAAIRSLDRLDPGAIVPVSARAEVFPIGCASTCRVRYRVDLSAAAQASGDALEVAVRSGPDLLAPASTWLLRPAPLPPDSPVTIRVHPAAGSSFRSGLRRGPSDDVIALRSRELPAAGYTAFGTFATVAVPVHGGVIDASFLGGSRRVSDAAVASWIAGRAATLDSVFHRFPVEHTAIFVLPEPGSAAVEFGRTLPSGGASIVLVVGEHADEGALARDWILEHELIHLGTPSFSGEGRWLDEGIAVYYEPVLLARAGLRSPPHLWGDLGATLAQGVPGRGDPGLLQSREHDRVYGGGATFVLTADVAIRARTAGARSFDDGLRAVLDAGGDATRVWTVAAFLDAIDRATSVPVTRELYAQALAGSACATSLAGFTAGPACVPGSPGELRALLGLLGVRSAGDDAVTLDDTAALARVRRRIEGEGEDSADASAGRGVTSRALRP